MWGGFFLECWVVFFGFFFGKKDKKMKPVLEELTKTSSLNPLEWNGINKVRHFPPFST